MTLVTSGYGFPNAVLQHAIGDLDRLSIDIDHLNAKRNRMLSALREMGYDVTTPEGTFYLLARSPIDDDYKFADMLADHDVFVGPGTLFELPGFFRISLTATMEMIERALPVFDLAMKQLTEPVLAGVAAD
jgi:aspartate aminotransferase